MPNSYGEEIVMERETYREIREVDPATRLLEVVGYARDLLLNSEPGELCADQEGFRDASNELSVSLDLPPERVVSLPEDLVKQVVEQERRDRMKDYITLAYYVGVIGAYNEVLLPLVERIELQDAAIVMSSHKDGDNVRIKNTPREVNPNWHPVADHFDSKLYPINLSKRSY